MKKFFTAFLVGLVGLSQLFFASPAFAAGSITPSGGGKFVTGQTFTITVKAGGTTFDSLQGTIKVSGVAELVSFSAGSATWLPGKSPGNNNQFVGIVSPTSSLTVATIRLKANKEGSGSVSVSGVRLARSGSEVGTGGGSTSYTIGRAPTPPGNVEVSSSTHPDQNQFYGATTAILTWKPPANGATGYSALMDQAAETVPATSISTTETSATFQNLSLGTYYFHIRALNGDGWGPTTHFKINIKEELNPSLNAPVITAVERTGTFVNDVEKGTVSGFKVKGITAGLTGFTVNLVFTPGDKLPPAQILSALLDPNGGWEIIFDQPIPTGFYAVITRAKMDKVVTPDSAPTMIEVSVANGGTAKIITSDDLPKPDLTVSVAGVTFSTQKHLWVSVALIILFAVLVTALAYVLRLFYKRWKQKKSAKTSPASSPSKPISRL
ncbi:MAG: fibronectin type III domain-containing protein [Candidatus Berkelbacteria bacterium]|nr:MAG: fibronectin type III domain-containing protein [Candidatus Berkelbacteria bacterium]QQG51694.1 MAG: fibronectin type III domain-containing protein [Candidatus Berkelbacteria bacterium]